jgi:hypothetical protein
MQRYTIFFIAVNALRVSGGFSSHHQELKSLIYTRGCVYSFELLMMGGETAWNTYSIDSNKEYCICCILLVILKRIRELPSLIVHSFNCS